MEELLRFTQGEGDRQKKEVRRLNELVRRREGERDAARSGAEAAAGKAQSSELELASLRAASSVPPEIAAEQGKCREALVSKSMAEQRVVLKDQELKAMEGAQEAMMQEIEMVSATYEEVQAKSVGNGAKQAKKRRSTDRVLPPPGNFEG